MFDGLEFNGMGGDTVGGNQSRLDHGKIMNIGILTLVHNQKNC